MKYVTILIDGMADEETPALDGKTPLEYANIPVINELAKYSELGLVKTVPEGMPPGSDVANLSVMGYAPDVYHTGRSPLEAASVGVELSDTDVTFRCNFVTVSDEKEYSEKTMIDHSAGDITSEEAQELVEALKAELETDEIKYYAGVSYRNLIVWKEGPLEFKLVPPHDFLGKTIKNYLPSGKFGNVIYDMTLRSHEILKNHPVNIARVEKGLNPANSVWIWGEGKKPSLDSFKEKFGVEGAAISAVDLIKGIAICAELESIDIPGATGNLETNFEGKAQGVIDALKAGKDFVYLHLEAPDECGHQGHLGNKIKSIEIIDQKVVKFLKAELDKLGEDYKIMILPDHPTPVRTRTHTSDPVPYMIYDSRDLAEKGSVAYNERTCGATGNYFPEGCKLAEYFLKE